MSGLIPSSVPATWRAPGKLVLLGEYAVLDGAGAIVAAVDHGVDCRRSPGRLGWSTPGDDRFVRHVLQTLPLEIGQFAFTDWNPVQLQGAKAGFGGSAASVVAAVLAAGRPPLSAFDVHRAVQGGGSGVDVYASLNGGVRRVPDGKRVPMPPFAVVWSGRSALTGPRLKQFEAWGRADPRAKRAFVRASRALVDGFGGNPVGATREAWGLLRAMARAARLEYETPELVALAALAESLGGAGKPSGAGGGDIAVSAFVDSERRDAYTARCADLGFTVIPCAIAEPACLYAMHGPRIDLVPFTPERLVLALEDRPGLARSLGASIPASWPQPDYAAVMRVLAERWSLDAREADWAWLVVDAPTDGPRRLVGEIGGKVGPSRKGELEFGYAIIPERRGEGLAKEAAAVFAAWARGQPGVKVLTAECVESNLASRAVLRSVGLSEVGARMEAGNRLIRLRG